MERSKSRVGPDLQIEMFIPVWVQGTLGDLGGLCLLAVDGSDGERIGKSCDGDTVSTCSLEVVRKVYDKLPWEKHTEDISLV